MLMATMAHYQLYGGPLDGRLVEVEADLKMFWVSLPDNIRSGDAITYREPPVPPYVVYQAGDPVPHKARWLGTVHS